MILETTFYGFITTAVGKIYSILVGVAKQGSPIRNIIVIPD